MPYWNLPCNRLAAEIGQNVLDIVAAKGRQSSTVCQLLKQVHRRRGVTSRAELVQLVLSLSDLPNAAYRRLPRPAPSVQTIPIPSPRALAESPRSTATPRSCGHRTSFRPYRRGRRLETGLRRGVRHRRSESRWPRLPLFPCRTSSRLYNAWMQNRPLSCSTAGALPNRLLYLLEWKLKREGVRLVEVGGLSVEEGALVLRRGERRAGYARALVLPWL